ncbi:pectate lyase [Roseiconus lacunae]|uniref:pectate lyase n=1 Tax=Roseiconus lacunae TaxID=2605694 RepID=UPI001E6525F8|nr:pectate lyase [Roseiconus lacunae]MCD0462471.1 pectate lyase [Roseiconus lacunae]
MKTWLFLLFTLVTLVGTAEFKANAQSGDRDENAAKTQLKRQALQTAKKATTFLTEKVSTNGGYLWRYSSDLQLKEGEGVVESETVWVQPPGTPAVGLAFVALFHATGDPQFRDAALAASEALRQGQMHSGGWQASIEFDPERRKKWAYRVESPHRKKKDQSSLDDNKTQSALLFLIRLDEALQFKNELVHHTAEYGLRGLLNNGQFKNGGFPQVWMNEKTSDHLADPVKASYPDDWPRVYPGHQQYWLRYTLNDQLASDTMKVLFEAERIYQKPEFREAAIRLADSLLAAQMPEPQPAWAQQYNAEMQPIWARKFEPPAITTSESFGVINTLMDVYLQTGEKRYLASIPRALDYLKTCELPGGRVARFYELKTNRPLYFDLAYQLTYDDSDMPTHYGFQLGSKVDQLRRRYTKVTETASPQGASLLDSRPKASESKVRAIIASQTDHGIWLNQDGMRYHKSKEPAIDMQEVVTNLQTLAAFLR